MGAHCANPVRLQRLGAQVSAGETFTFTELDRIKHALRSAETVSGLTFSLFVGISEEDSRAYAQRLHSALDRPEHSVLVMCDPGFHALEIVTGSTARRTLDDVGCGLAAAAMQTSFVAGDIAGGLVLGIQQLGASARAPRTLHSKAIDS